MKRALACGFLLLLASSVPKSGASQIRRCVGPAGQLHFTDRDCPDGFAEVSSLAASERAIAEPNAEDWERSCRYVSMMTSAEAATAIAAVDGVLAALRAGGDAVSVERWAACRAELARKSGAPAPPPERDGARPRPNQEPGQVGAEVCVAGAFDTENGVSSFDAYFTNHSAGGCRTVSAYCLCSVSFGAYRQSREFTVAGRFAPGERTFAATVPVTGPTAGGIDWSWCRLRGASSAPVPER